MKMQTLYLIVPLAPLLGAVIIGLFGKAIGRSASHWVAIAGVAVSFMASIAVFRDVLAGHEFNGGVYTWLESDGLKLEVGFLIDRLSALMMLVVTFISLMVHIYTVGYMADDPGYQRFFSYISLFTFSMLMLVMANNFLQLFFGWEAVGLMSYLLIGFWYDRPTATYASLKAFIVNRIGDFGFILGIGLIAAYAGTLDYAHVFAQRQELASLNIELFAGSPWLLLTVICICLFIGAMGKSAQFPLHVWLPDSMEGPTPISALIHAATMVTAGIFMVSRMSPLFELSETALSFVLVIGAITALFMGLLGIVQNDIKRIIAYSTLSQLGYMTVALGVSAYAAAEFHLMTHAFFKALLFLAAGSVIIACHHNQDIRRMGGLWKHMKITWITALIGSLALIGFPFISGFYSKDAIIEAVKLSNLPGSGFASFAVTAGVFVTAVYTFRMFFLVFHGEEHFRESCEATHDAPLAPLGREDGGEGKNDHKPQESPWVVWLPLVLLAIPSVVIGFLTVDAVLFGNYFGNSIVVDAGHSALAQLQQQFPSSLAMALHGLVGLPFLLAMAGVALTWFLYLKRPDLPATIRSRLAPIYTLLDNKYYLDKFNDWFFAGGARLIGRGLWKGGDQALIDGVVVNGSAQVTHWIASLLRHFQTGYISQYAFAMVFGVFVLLTLWFNRI